MHSVGFKKDQFERTVQSIDNKDLHFQYKNYMHLKTKAYRLLLLYILLLSYISNHIIPSFLTFSLLSLTFFFNN